MSLNDEQKSYMKYLSTVEPSAKCYCGWYMAGECYNCKRAGGAHLTLADRFKVQCPSPMCRNYPSIGYSKVTHNIACTTPDWQPT